MKDRIKKLMESQHMTQKEFAKFTGINEATLSGIFNDRTRPTLQTVDAIHNRFPKLSVEWLMFGTGPMEVGASAASAPSSSTEESASSNSQNAASSPLLFDTPSQQETSHKGEFSKEGPKTVIKYIDKPQRHITEIRIFYDDQTWESFTPKK